MDDVKINVLNEEIGYLLLQKKKLIGECGQSIVY